MKKKILGLLGGILSLLLLFQMIPPVKAAENNPFLLPEGARPLIIAHRGGKLLYPENTMIAFDNAVDLGVDVLEMDVMLTQDGILVTHHDETIDRTSNGSGKVSDYTYEGLLQFNFGYGFKDVDGQALYQETFVPIPRLEEVLAKHSSLPMVIELKDKGELGYRAAEALKELLIHYHMTDRVIIGSFHDDVLNYFTQISQGEIPTSTAKGETTKFVLLHKAYLDLFYFGQQAALQLPVAQGRIQLDTKRLIKAAHRRNMAVQYWTINDREEMRRLIELGADGIITDRPDVMKDLLLEMGY